MKAAGTITSMAELRREIDRVDSELVALLAERCRYIDRAVALKPAEGMSARIGARVEQVVANVRQCAVLNGLEPELVETVWRLLIDWSIRREEAVLGPSVQD